MKHESLNGFDVCTTSSSEAGLAVPLKYVLRHPAASQPLMKMLYKPVRLSCFTHQTTSILSQSRNYEPGTLACPSIGMKTWSLEVMLGTYAPPRMVLPNMLDDYTY